MPDWVTRGFEEYQRRFPRDMPLELIEIPAGKRGKNADIARILQKEGELMLAAIAKGNHIVSLDLPGKNWTTPDLAEQMTKWQLDGRDVSLLIGGPEGLSPACKEALTAGLNAGAWCGWLSGSGPTVAIMCAAEQVSDISKALPEGGRTEILHIDFDGAVVL